MHGFRLSQDEKYRARVAASLRAIKNQSHRGAVSGRSAALAVIALTGTLAFGLAPATSLAARAKSVQEASTVNVNTAQQSELQSARGFDKVTAKRVIEYRNQHGFYRSLGDLEKALGADTTEKVAERVAFDGPPYVPPPKPAKKKK